MSESVFTGSIETVFNRFVDTVGSLVKSVFSEVNKVFTPLIEAMIKTISPILQNSELMKKLIPMLAVAIPPPYDLIAVVAVEVLCKLSGKEENPEELGYQMNESDKAPEEFESFEQYRAYLDERFPFDREKFNSLLDEQKSACRLTGIAGTICEMKESIGKEIEPNTIGALTNLVKEKLFNSDELKVFISDLIGNLSNEGLDPLKTISDYTKQAVAPDDYDKLMSSCEKTLAEIGTNSLSAIEIMSTLANPSCAESL